MSDDLKCYSNYTDTLVASNDEAYWSYCLKLFGESLTKLETEFNLPDKWSES